MSQFALYFDAAAVQIHDFLNVIQSQTIPLGIVYIPLRYAEELIKDVLEVLLGDADAVILNGNHEHVLLIGGCDFNNGFGRCIF